MKFWPHGLHCQDLWRKLPNRAVGLMVSERTIFKVFPFTSLWEVLLPWQPEIQCIIGIVMPHMSVRLRFAKMWSFLSCFCDKIRCVSFSNCANYHVWKETADCVAKQCLCVKCQKDLQCFSQLRKERVTMEVIN